MRKLFVLTIAAVFLMAGNVMALSLYDITKIDGTQKYLDTGAESLVLVDTDATLDDATAFLLFEFAGNAGVNQFGIYEYSIDGDGKVFVEDKLQVFAGGVSPTDSATIQFDLATGTAWMASAPSVVMDIDATFGLYIETVDADGNVLNTFYSHTSLNSDSFDHMMIFDTTDNSVGKLYGSNVVIGIEDLYEGGDKDYNDMVVGISDVAPAPIPEPSTVLLLGGGLLGMVAFGRKYMKK